MEAKTIECTKANLKKVIMWSGSQKNEQSKQEVVNEITELFKQRSSLDTVRTYSARFYTIKRVYKLVVKNGSAHLIDTNEKVTYFLKEKRSAKNAKS